MAALNFGVNYLLLSYEEVIIKDKFSYYSVWSILVWGSVTSKKSPNVYKSCPKMISLEKLKILTPLQKLPKNVGDSEKLVVAKDFENLPIVQ